MTNFAQTWHEAATTSAGLLALYILAVLLLVLVVTALLLHYGFAVLGVPPTAGTVRSVIDREFFAFDYTAAANALFIAMTLVFVVWKWRAQGLVGHGGGALSDRILFGLALLAYAWLAAGLTLPLFFNV